MNCEFQLSYFCEGENKQISGLTENDDLSLAISDDGKRRTVIITAKKKIKLLSYREFGHDFIKSGDKTYDEKGDLYFLNGYQSWTETREFYGDARERNVKNLPPLLVRRFAFDRYGDAAFYGYDRKLLHGYDVFYVKGSANTFIISLNAKNAYLIVEVKRNSGEVFILSDVDGKALKEGDAFTLVDYAYTDGYEKGLEEFYSHYPAKPVKKIFGYTSWYNYYQNVNEEIILRDLDGLDETFNLFQIDDGYETFVGDWLDVDPIKFPNGLKPIAEKIHDEGYMAGIWLAPFVAEEKSVLFRTRPDLFKRDENGGFVKCGSNWSGFYALDLENPDAAEYIRKCLTHYSDMGFDFFKLDFLYAASLPVYEGKTRSEAAEYAYSLLREILGDKLILGCGATLFNAAGKFDYMRIGPDVSLDFDDVWYMRFMHRERVSTKVTLQNTVYRSFMRGALFGNDPDVFLLRDDNIKLTEKQRYALITLNALFGDVMMTSDNVAEYDDEKRKTLSYALDLFVNAKVKKYSRSGDLIRVAYELRGQEKNLTYNVNKGELL